MDSLFPWLLLLTHIAILLLVDLFVLHRKHFVPSTKRALLESLFFFLNALIFGVFVYFLYDLNWVQNINNLGPTNSVIKYFSAYFIELSLSVDNLFVIALIFSTYKIPQIHQHKLLFLGIVGALIFRGIFIGVGLVLIHQLEFISIVFGLFLLYTAVKMLKKEEEQLAPKQSFILRFFKISNTLDGGNFRTVIEGKRVFTALFAALVSIEFTDVLFAIDSIPAVFSVTSDPFLVFSSNIFALMGLRSLYFFLANILSKFTYLKYSVFAILIFVALKLMSSPWLELPEWYSLCFIVIALVLGVWLSVRKMKAKL